MRLLAVLALMIGMTMPATAQELPTEYTIEMWNQDPNNRQRRMVFSEELVAVAEGAAVTWLSTDRGHNVEFIHGPAEETLRTRSRLNEDYTFTFDTPGIYVYVCTPHVSMAMLGVVVVGEHTAEQIVAALNTNVRGSGKRKLEELLGNLE